MLHRPDGNSHATLTPGGADPGGCYRERGARTVWGIGRPSLVEFEHHEYGLQAIPDDLRYTSPDKLRLRADRSRGLGPNSTVKSPPTGPDHGRVG